MSTKRQNSMHYNYKQSLSVSCIKEIKAIERCLNENHWITYIQKQSLVPIHVSGLRGLTGFCHHVVRIGLPWGQKQLRFFQLFWWVLTFVDFGWLRLNKDGTLSHPTATKEECDTPITGFCTKTANFWDKGPISQNTFMKLMGRLVKQIPHF